MKNRTATAKRSEMLLDQGLGALPPQAAKLIGRDDELATVRAQVLAEDVRLLTVIGPGGVGKTRLAVAVAESLRGNPGFSDIRFADLAPLPEPTLVAAAIARAVGAPHAGMAACSRPRVTTLGPGAFCWFWTISSTCPRQPPMYAVC